MPVGRLFEDEHVVAFRHPRPAYDTHVLIVPKMRVRSIESVGERHGDMLVSVAKATQQCVRDLQLEASGYRLVVNGGGYQDVKQLHFHLVSGAGPPGPASQTDLDLEDPAPEDGTG